jgi:hypothetical protein
MQELRDKIIRLETTVDHLKESDIKLEKKIIELEKSIMTRLDEMQKESSQNFKKIEEYLNKQRGGWKVITVIGSAVVGVFAVISYILKLFN